MNHIQFQPMKLCYHNDLEPSKSIAHWEKGKERWTECRWVFDLALVMVPWMVPRWAWNLGKHLGQTMVYEWAFWMALPMVWERVPWKVKQLGAAMVEVSAAAWVPLSGMV